MGQRKLLQAGKFCIAFARREEKWEHSIFITRTHIYIYTPLEPRGWMGGNGRGWFVLDGERMTMRDEDGEVFNEGGEAVVPFTDETIY